MTAPKPKTEWTAEELDSLFESMTNRVKQRITEATQLYYDAIADVDAVIQENEARLDQAETRVDTAYDALLAEAGSLGIHHETINDATGLTEMEKQKGFISTHLPTLDFHTSLGNTLGRSPSWWLPTSANLG